jgi:hypothetical protein
MVDVPNRSRGGTGPASMKDMTTHKSPPKEEQVKREVADQPGRDDVHEQREPAQEKEGVVHEPNAPPKTQPAEPTVRR